MTVTELVRKLPESFMEPGNSLFCSQQSTTGPNSDPDKPSSHPPTQFP